MIARLSSLSPRAIAALAVFAVLVYAAASWFLVVSPKRAEVASLQVAVRAAETRLAEAQAAASPPQVARVPVADVLSLARAMPGSSDQAGLVLELSALAERSGLTLRSISPQAPAEGAGGAMMIPVTVTVDGAFFKIAKFLQLARRLVVFRGGKVTATGRVLTVQGIELVESQAGGFPKLDGTIVLNAYVYDGPIAPPAQAQAPDGTTEPTGTAAAGSTS